MSLATIRSNIAADTGYHPDTSDDDKKYLNAQINIIVQALYKQNDLVGSLQEIITFFDVDTKLLSLPYFVGHVRGARYYDSPFLGTLRDIRPRFATDGYTIQLTDFREIGTSTLAIQLNEWSVLTFSLPEGEVSEKDLIIAVIGETPVAARVEEQLKLQAGQNSVTTVNNWREAPRVILKNDVNNFNIYITDVNGNDVGIIPNNQLAPVYSVWQFRDDNMTGQLSINAVEILYKEKLNSLVNDYDEFLGGRYDEVVQWLFLDQYWSKQEGKDALAQEARNQWASKLADVNRDNAVGKKAEMQMVSNKFYGLFNSIYTRNRIYGGFGGNYT